MDDVEAMRDLLSRLDRIKDWAKLVEEMSPQQRHALLEALRNHNRKDID
jgi:Mg/Co/Ni transporter MgtE